MNSMEFNSKARSAGFDSACQIAAIIELSEPKESP